MGQYPLHTHPASLNEGPSLKHHHNHNKNNQDIQHNGEVPDADAWKLRFNPWHPPKLMLEITNLSIIIL